jgi:hypothetical protein
MDDFLLCQLPLIVAAPVPCQAAFSAFLHLGADDLAFAYIHVNLFPTLTLSGPEVPYTLLIQSHPPQQTKFFATVFQTKS